MIQVLGFDGSPFSPEIHCSAKGDRFIRAFLLLKFSGNYVAGGDTLDLTNGGGTPAAPNTVPPAVSKGPAQIYIEGRGPTGGFSGGGGYGVVIPPAADAPLTFADAAALKLKLWKTNGATEYAAGAYGADITGDTFIAEVVWPR